MVNPMFVMFFEHLLFQERLYVVDDFKNFHYRFSFRPFKSIIVIVPLNCTVYTCSMSLYGHRGAVSVDTFGLTNSLVEQN